MQDFEPLSWLAFDKMHEAMVQTIDAHKIRPPIDRRFRFEDAKDAYRSQASPDLFGKIVIELAQYSFCKRKNVDLKRVDLR